MNRRDQFPKNHLKFSNSSIRTRKLIFDCCAHLANQSNFDFEPIICVLLSFQSMKIDVSKWMRNKFKSDDSVDEFRLLSVVAHISFFVLCPVVNPLSLRFLWWQSCVHMVNSWRFTRWKERHRPQTSNNFGTKSARTKEWEWRKNKRWRSVEKSSHKFSFYFEE